MMKLLLRLLLLALSSENSFSSRLFGDLEEEEVGDATASSSYLSHLILLVEHVAVSHLTVLLGFGGSVHKKYLFRKVFNN
jgi:hypothetical protein